MRETVGWMWACVISLLLVTLGLIAMSWFDTKSNTKAQGKSKNGADEKEKF